MEVPICSRILSPRLIRFCPRVPHLIKILPLDVLLQKPVTTIVIHFAMVLLLDGIVVKINHTPFFAGEPLEPPQGPRRGSFQFYCKR